MKTITVPRTILIMLALWLSLLISGCNTMEGAGKDVQSAGESIEDAAD
jgi:predicted small secreted protein